MASWQSMNARKPSIWGLDDTKMLSIRELIALEQAGNENAESDLHAGADESLLSQSIQVHGSLFSYAKYVKDVSLPICSTSFVIETRLLHDRRLSVAALKTKPSKSVSEPMTLNNFWIHRPRCGRLGHFKYAQNGAFSNMLRLMGIPLCCHERSL